MSHAGRPYANGPKKWASVLCAAACDGLRARERERAPTRTQCIITLAYCRVSEGRGGACSCWCIRQASMSPSPWAASSAHSNQALRALASLLLPILLRRPCLPPPKPLRRRTTTCAHTSSLTLTRH